MSQNQASQRAPQPVTRYNRAQTRAFQMVEVGFDEDLPTRLYDIVNFAAVILNLLATILFTFDNVKAEYGTVLHIIEAVTVAFFAVDYVLRLWTAPKKYPFDSKARAVGKYATSFNGIIDLISFLPFYLPWFFPSGSAAFRLFRVLRLFRLFRINAYYDSFNAITAVIKSKKQQLLSSIAILAVLMVASSLCMYSVEHNAQPDVFKNAFSGIWWATSTLLTVGYGDIYPITFAGRALGIIITFLGVFMVAIPTGILSAGFVQQYQSLKELGEQAAEFNLYFIKAELEEGDSWAGKTLAELDLPKNVIVAVVQRGDKTVMPRGDVTLLAGDALILGAESARSEWNPELRKLTLKEGSTWTGEQLKDLNLSRHTFIVMVRRGSEVIVPTGSTTFFPGDEVILYSQKHIPGSTKVTV